MSGFAKALSSAFAAGLLAACTLTPNGPQEALTTRERFPITLDPVVERLEIETSRDTAALLRSDQARIAAFLDDYVRRGRGRLAIMTPRGAANAGAAITIASEASKVLVAGGLPPDGFDIVPYVASGDSDPVYLAFTRLVATGPRCGIWTDDYAYVPRNDHHSNFGCATQANLAAMLTDPQDLKGPRAVDPADAARRETVIELYRKGEQTATERAKEESGQVSEVDKSE